MAMKHRTKHIMKNLLLLFSVGFLLSSCGGGGDNNSLEAVLSSGDVATLQAKKDELVTQQQDIQQQVKQLDAKLKELNPERNVPLITTFVATDTLFKHYVELQGGVETKQNLVITPEMGGILERVYVKEGDKVAKGQLLAKIDDGGLSQQLAQLQVQADLAKTTFERQERLWNQKIGSEIQYLQAKSNYEGQ